MSQAVNALLAGRIKAARGSGNGNCSSNNVRASYRKKCLFLLDPDSPLAIYAKSSKLIVYSRIDTDNSTSSYGLPKSRAMHRIQTPCFVCDSTTDYAGHQHHKKKLSSNWTLMWVLDLLQVQPFARTRTAHPRKRGKTIQLNCCSKTSECSVYTHTYIHTYIDRASPV